MRIHFEDAMGNETFKATKFKRWMEFIRAYNQIKKKYSLTSEAEILSRMGELSPSFADVSKNRLTASAIKMQFSCDAVPEKDYEAQIVAKYDEYIKNRYIRQKQALERARRAYQDEAKFEHKGVNYTGEKLRKDGKKALRKSRWSTVFKIVAVVAGITVGAGIATLIPGLFAGVMATSTLSAISTIGSIVLPILGGVAGWRIHESGIFPGVKERRQNNKDLAKFYTDTLEGLNADEYLYEKEKEAMNDLLNDLNLSEKEDGPVSEIVEEFKNDYIIEEEYEDADVHEDVHEEHEETEEEAGSDAFPVEDGAEDEVESFPVEDEAEGSGEDVGEDVAEDEGEDPFYHPSGETPEAGEAETSAEGNKSGEDAPVAELPAGEEVVEDSGDDITYVEYEDPNKGATEETEVSEITYDVDDTSEYETGTVIDKLNTYSDESLSDIFTFDEDLRDYKDEFFTRFPERKQRIGELMDELGGKTQTQQPSTVIEGNAVINKLKEFAEYDDDTLASVFKNGEYFRPYMNAFFTAYPDRKASIQERMNRTSKIKTTPEEEAGYDRQANEGIQKIEDEAFSRFEILDGSENDETIDAPSGYHDPLDDEQRATAIKTITTRITKQINSSESSMVGRLLLINLRAGIAPRVEKAQTAGDIERIYSSVKTAMAGVEKTYKKYAKSTLGDSLSKKGVQNLIELEAGKVYGKGKKAVERGARADEQSKLPLSKSKIWGNPETYLEELKASYKIQFTKLQEKYQTTVGTEKSEKKSSKAELEDRIEEAFKQYKKAAELEPELDRILAELQAQIGEGSKGKFMIAEGKEKAQEVTEAGMDE